MDSKLDRNIKEVKQQFKIVGNSPALDNAIERALKVAPFDLSVLVIGESGTGKEFFPQIIHKNSKRKSKSYIAINCGSIPEGTIDSELFGHVKGSFTGADKDRKGYFEVTNGGTIFLDEVAEMPLSTQARLLRVLQNGEYLKVGSDVVQKTNVRVVAATNKDLKKAVQEGKFREDLYYRLSTIQIDIPALRERTDDIKLIARVFAAEFADNYSTLPVRFSADALNTLAIYPWPGNVRQLKSFIESLCLFESGNEISADTIKNYLPKDTILTTSISTISEGQDINGVLMKMISMFNDEIKELKTRIFELENNKSTAPQQVALQHNMPAPTVINNIYANESADIPPQFEEQSLPALPNRKDILTIENSPVELVPRDNHLKNKIKEEYYDDMDLDEIGSNEEYKSLAEIEKEAIISALRRNKGKRKITAEQLKISERTLYRKIEEYNLND